MKQARPQQITPPSSEGRDWRIWLIMAGRGWGNPATVVGVSLTGNTTSDGSTTLTTGSAAQALFSGVTPANGYSISNPDPVNDSWVSDSTTAAINGLGSIRVASNGGYYATEPGQKPLDPVSVVGPATAQKITARRW